MSHLVRYRHLETGETAVGVRRGESIVPTGRHLAELWTMPLTDLQARCLAADDEEVPVSQTALLPPIDGRTEVWAAGVTYERSREARRAESEASADVYQRVYDADRPELFFKSAAWRVVGEGGPIAVRADSRIDVPEPELALVVNAYAEIVGYTICDDVSSRTIEGENPLYLPQAKTYLGACALGPQIRPAWEVADPYALSVHMVITRGGQVVWAGESNTSRLHRRLTELVDYLFAADRFPDGVVLSTGTSLVPELPFTLHHGDQVEIRIDQIGTLTTPVIRGVPGGGDG